MKIFNKERLMALGFKEMNTHSDKFMIKKGKFIIEVDWFRDITLYKKNKNGVGILADKESELEDLLELL
jgi:hypothetical protein